MANSKILSRVAATAVMLGLASSLAALAQGYSAHSTSLGISQRDGSPPIVVNPFREIQLWSDDGEGFKLTVPACRFDIGPHSFDAAVESQIRQQVQKDLSAVGWVGEISFIGLLGNPVRNITQNPLPGFRCSDPQVQHVIAIAPWAGETQLLDQLVGLERLMALGYQINLEDGSLIYYFAPLRVDVVTPENLKKWGTFMGAFAKAVLPKWLDVP